MSNDVKISVEQFERLHAKIASMEKALAQMRPLMLRVHDEMVDHAVQEWARDRAATLMRAIEILDVGNGHKPDCNPGSMFCLKNCEPFDQPLERTK